MSRYRVNTKPLPVSGKAPYQPVPVPVSAIRGNYRGESESPPRVAATRQRGRPRNRTLEGSSLRMNSTNRVQDLIKLLVRMYKTHGRLVPTENNGFNRNLKPDVIVDSFATDDGEPMFFLRFKCRKIPELITLTEMKRRAPTILIEFYSSRLTNAYEK
ncbi:uncharacterized protein LOC116805901 [Drosophila grimshawi]|uniref:uncharacterized protein LOC116805901 n=1 Tax=Drosophila grimshawi TaxID=7222 RepID=UPI000C87146A|nr:uncharacterized protein LOC116805901 [Drosophila grimshawi]